MGRPAKPAAHWDPDRQVWTVRVSLPKPPGWPKGKEAPRRTYDLEGIPEGKENQERADGVAQLVSDKLRKGEAVEPGAPETVAMWWARYFKWRTGRPQAKTLRQRERSVKRWILPILGPLAMVAVTADDLRRVVKHLDGAVAKGDIKPKRAVNLWGEVTKAFADACTVNDATIRVREGNPAERVSAPDRGDIRQKPFLRPAELTQLVSCEAVPLYRRRLYAVAAYTGARIGEIRALTPADVDLESMQILITKQASRMGKVEDWTKTGKARVIPIEASLLPLLRILVAEKRPTLLHVPNEDHALIMRRESFKKAGLTREALFADDKMRAPMVFHNLRDTCLTHMAVRRDPPQDIQWRAGHTTPAMTEKYIAQARFAAGANFGTPFPPLPASLLGVSALVSDFGCAASNDSERLRCEGGDLNPYRSYPTRT
jgi:integrase